MSLLGKDITKKRYVDKATSQLEFDDNKGNKNSKEYKVKVIWDSAVYAKEAEDHLPELYYLVLWKGYLEEENT